MGLYMSHRIHGAGISANEIIGVYGVIYHIYTWWIIPLSKWVVTLVISGLTLLIPLYNQGYVCITQCEAPFDS